MADSSTILVVKQQDPLIRNGLVGRELHRRILEHLESYISGARRGYSIDVFPDGASPVAASGTVTISSGSGTITATINGVNVQVTWATSDDNTASLLAAAINASSNALVQYLVTASASSGVVTVTAAQKGITGNAITLAASGTGATASGARLTGGAGGNVSSVTISL